MNRALLPSVALLLRASGLPPHGIKATGPKGHLLKGDVLTAIHSQQRGQPKTISRMAMAGERLNGFLALSNDPQKLLQRAWQVARRLTNAEIEEIEIIYTAESKTVILSGANQSAMAMMLRILQHPSMLHL